MDQDTVSELLTLLSHNTTGWGKFKAKFLRSIIDSKDIDIAVIQEHFLLKQNLFKLQEYFPDFDIFALPAVKNNSQITRGRPSGGLAFLYKNKFGNKITRIEVPNSNRVQGLKLDLHNESYVFINAYFPVDKRNRDIDDLITVLQDISFIFDKYHDQCKIVLLGDLNCDFNRNTVFVNYFVNYVFEHNLQRVWSKFNCDFTYCHTSNIDGVERSSLSTIDHFFVSQDLLKDCVDAFPIHSQDNLSNHSPIYMKFYCPIGEIETELPDTFSSISSSKPVWNRASIDDLDNFKLNLDQLVNNIDVPVEALSCTDVHCNNVQHRVDIDVYAACLMGCISSAVENNIPHVASGGGDSTKKIAVPGWSDYVKPFREDSLFWHSVWISAGRPLNTVLHNVMKHARKKYHCAIRYVKCQESELRKNKLLQQCLSGNINDILQHIKSSRKNKSVNARNIDGVSGTENIASHFKNIYKNIYNQHGDTNKADEILSDINSKITRQDIVELDKISSTLIKNAIGKLNSGKNDSAQNWNTDALKCGVDILSGHFCSLFKSYLVHGFISELFLTCSLIPIVKNSNESKLMSDNYRLIAISSLMVKIFDYAVLTLFSETLSSVNLQFGYQKNCSTTMCTWTLRETVNYFTSRESSVFVCLLDLSKAFDTIKHDILFKKLAEKIPPLFLRVIIFSYLHQKCAVKWGNFESDQFSVSNGVRQGAVLSPVFFNVYLDELFIILKNCGLGCMIDHFYYGLLGYADDCALLSPSRNALQKMLNICSKYFHKHGIKISTNTILAKSKTKCLAFNVQEKPADIILYNRILPWVDSYKHLGHFLTSDEDMCHDLLQKRAEFIGKIHALRQEMGDQNPIVFMSLVSIYLCSFYGSNLWDLYSESAQSLYTSWNICLRQTFNLPFATHRYILLDLYDKPHIRISLLRRFVKFYDNLKLSKKSEVRHLFELQKMDNRSTFGRNCYNLCRELNVERMEDVNTKLLEMPLPYVVNETEMWRSPFLKELLLMRDQYLDNVLSKTELDNLIDFVCCK